MKLVKLVHLEFDVVFVSGTRISGGGGPLEIGGTIDANLAVLRDPISREPYLPGSSLKGKLRSIAEKAAGKTWGEDDPCHCGELSCPICPVFGAHMKTKAESAPTRITVRDAFFTESSRAKWQNRLDEETETVEQKAEVVVGRKSGTGSNPRTGERVPPGAAFHAHLILHIYEADMAGTPPPSAKYEDTISNALAILVEGESLGASGSRGYGEVRLENLTRREVEVAGLRVAFQNA